MNADASNVEDINIRQIKERLSMSCIASYGELSCIFRNRSSTLFKKDRDLRERFDSVAVSESISSSMTNLLDTGPPVLVPDISPDFHTWEDHLSSLFHPEEFDEPAPNTSLPVLVCCTFNELRSTFWFSDLVFSGLSDAVEASTFGSLTRCRHTKFIIGFDSCCDSFFTCISWCSFRHRFKTIDGTEMADVDQTQKMIPFITCEISLFASMSASWFMVSINLIWILGSKFILSNNQSRPTARIPKNCQCKWL